MKCDVLDRQKKFPERLRHFGIFAPRRQQKINREHGEVGRHDSQRAAGEKPAEFDALTARKRHEQLAADQITAKGEEKIDADPAKAVYPARQFETEKRSVINNDHDDGKRAEKIEAGLTFAISKARIDSHLATVSLRPNAHQSLFGSCAEIVPKYSARAPKSGLDWRYIPESDVRRQRSVTSGSLGKSALVAGGTQSFHLIAQQN